MDKKIIKIIGVSILLELFISIPVMGQNIIGFAPYYRSFGAETDLSLYTHIHFFAVWPDSSGNLAWPGSHDSTSLHQKYEQLRSRIQPDKQKILITFGGTSGGGSRNFSHMAGDSTSLELFCNNAVNLCTAWDADGMDIDWEWGVKLNSDQDTLRIGYARLMARLRELSDQEGLLLSTDVSASSWFGDNYPVDGVDQAHYINVMTYTYNGTWSSTANHHSPYVKSENIGMNYWLSKGISLDKLNPGVPFYGMKYEGASAPEDPFSKTSALTYSEVNHLISSGYKVVEEPENGSYCYSDSSIVFYDSPSDLVYKAEKFKAKGYPGIFIWEIGQDDESRTLSKAIYEGINGPSSMFSHTDHGYRAYYRSGAGIVVAATSEDRFDVHIYSMEGKRMAESKNNYFRCMIPTNGLPRGIYVALFRSGNAAFSQKIVIND